MSTQPLAQRTVNQQGSTFCLNFLKPTFLNKLEDLICDGKEQEAIQLISDPMSYQHDFGEYGSDNICVIMFCLETQSFSTRFQVYILSYLINVFTNALQFEQYEQINFSIIIEAIEHLKSSTRSQAVRAQCLLLELLMTDSVQEKKPLIYAFSKLTKNNEVISSCDRYIFFRFEESVANSIAYSMRQPHEQAQVTDSIAKVVVLAQQQYVAKACNFLEKSKQAALKADAILLDLQKQQFEMLPADKIKKWVKFDQKALHLQEKAAMYLKLSDLAIHFNTVFNNLIIPSLGQVLDCWNQIIHYFVSIENDENP